MVETRLDPFLAEFRPPREATGRAGEFYLENGYYENADAELLYAMIRYLKPARLLELGSGYSTLVSAAACEANERDGYPVEFVAVDADPRIAIDRVRGLTAVERRNSMDLRVERFLELDAGDVLFVDTTHTVKRGSEVNFLVLQVLPRLRPGVVVHFHDIFLPYEYPRAWFARGTFVNEQYLLQAFLACNPLYEIVLAAHGLFRQRHERLGRVIESAGYARTGPAAFWLRRTDRKPAARADSTSAPAA